MANVLTTQQKEALLREYERRQQEAWADKADYDRALMRQMQDELAHYWEFQAWLRFVHPNVIEEWRALQKVKGE